MLKAIQQQSDAVPAKTKRLLIDTLNSSVKFTNLSVNSTKLASLTNSSSVEDKGSSFDGVTAGGIGTSRTSFKFKEANPKLIQHKSNPLVINTSTSPPEGDKILTKPVTFAAKPLIIDTSIFPTHKNELSVRKEEVNSALSLTKEILSNKHSDLKSRPVSTTLEPSSVISKPLGLSTSAQPSNVALTSTKPEPKI